jgi:predicted chitinase
VAVSLTPSQLKSICPEAPASAVLPLNAILALTQSLTHLRAAMLVAQLAASSRSFRQMEEQDGPRRQASAPYFGRGWIQLTGRRQYREAAAALDLDLLRQPELVLAHYSEVTAWFWNAKHLHAFSDSGDVEACARAIAGGGATPKRLADARAMYDRACAVLVGARQVAA